MINIKQLILLFGAIFLISNLVEAIHIYSPHYLSGHIGFTTAHFGGFYVNTNCREVREVVLANPLDLCNEPMSFAKLGITTNYTDKIIIAARGKCSFVQKAVIAERLGAYGLIVVNSEGGEMHSLSDDGTEASFAIRIQVVMIQHDKGNQIMHYIEQKMQEDTVKNGVEHVDKWERPKLLASLGYCATLEYHYF